MVVQEKRTLNLNLKFSFNACLKTNSAFCVHNYTAVQSDCSGREEPDGASEPLTCNHIYSKCEDVRQDLLAKSGLLRIVFPLLFLSLSAR